MDSAFNPQPVVDPHEKKKFYFADTPQRRSTIALARFLFSFIMAMDVRGRENFPEQGAVIVVANYVTDFDVFPLRFALPRPIFFMAKAELFKFPLMDVMIRNLSAFPVNRGEKDEWATRHAAKVLAHNLPLGMFPEGKRSKGRGLAVAKTGTARLAIEANCPILPVAVTGADNFLKRFPRRTGVQVTVLPVLMPNLGESPLALTDRLMFTLAQALPEEMRGVYSEMPEGFKVPI